MHKLIGEWAAYLAATGASPNTIKLRTGTITAICRQVGVDDPLLLTRGNVIAYLGREIKPWSRKTYWSSLKQWCVFLADFDYSTTDLLRGIPRPKAPPPVARPLTDEQVTALLKLPLPLRASAYVRLALFAGLRVHEIARLRSEDFDLSAGWLLVEGKGGVTAPVPLHPEILALAESMPEIGWWFPSHVDITGHVTGRAVSTTIGAALRQIGTKATAHMLRDTCATRFQRKVKDIRLTQTMLRHRSVSSTQKYTGVADADMQAAVRSLDWGEAA